MPAPRALSVPLEFCTTMDSMVYVQPKEEPAGDSVFALCMGVSEPFFGEQAVVIKTESCEVIEPCPGPINVLLFSAFKVVVLNSPCVFSYEAVLHGTMIYKHKSTTLTIATQSRDYNVFQP